MAVLVPLAVWEKKLKLWVLPVAMLPAFLYVLAGTAHHNNFFWYLTGYKSYENILGLPYMDGLLGTIVRGVGGNITELIQGSFMLLYFLANCFLVVFFVQKRHILLAGLAMPPLILGIYLPGNEIWSMVNYSTYTVVPLTLFLETKNPIWLRNTRLQSLLLLLCFISQIGYAVYVAFIFYPPH